MELPGPDQTSLLSKKYFKNAHKHTWMDTSCGRWKALIKDKGGKRVFLGTHTTEYLAARCQDRALLKLKRSARGNEPVQLNFDEADYAEDEELRNSLSDEEFIELLKAESRKANENIQEKTKCLEKFLEDEAQGRVAEIESLRNSQSTRDHQHKKMKLKIKDLRKLYEGEPSDEVAPINISDEEMAKKLEAGESYYYPNCKKSHSLNFSQEQKLANKKEDSEPAMEKLLLNFLDMRAVSADPPKTPRISITLQSAREKAKGLQRSPNSDDMCIKQPKSAIATQKLREEKGGALSLVATSEKRRKRMDSEELPAAKVAKTFNGCLEMRSVKQINIASTSSATASQFCEYNLNLPSFATHFCKDWKSDKTSDPHEELCEHEAAFTLCLLKNLPIKTSDDKITTSSDDDLYNLHLLARVCEDARLKKFLEDEAQGRVPEIESLRNSQSATRDHQHKNINEEDDQERTWEQRLAKQYHDKLFKEYCIADMSRYKENRIGLRWRTEKEVISGKGQFECGNKKCSAREGLRRYAVNLRVCPKCTLKLNYRKEKELEKCLRKESRRPKRVMVKERRERGERSREKSEKRKRGSRSATEDNNTDDLSGSEELKEE